MFKFLKLIQGTIEVLSKTNALNNKTLDKYKIYSKT